ncbi:helix-turn-helix transcriptional regulator [Paenibacillus validus]|uniref:helix-turn-helix domain-containing protein n=1 Tax=Paenibacillus TaxID=44249 RepID=UPI0006D03111|nr:MULTISPECIES: helix-turn-helix transcriptional regulator [Paenibacillus]MED4599687.1 helix-turn-helix transcriptional regulator [Paenibacillus validus]MED4604880.1 helix-turn-helix transcriptional regulator [Paenibacillus validus]NTZ19046.1 XRE family transcriptional regulator [Paenibacillus sp. JMULE4]
MNSIRDSLGQRIRTLREQYGWTQEQLAERADLHPNYIGQIERGLKNVSLDNIYKLAVGLRMDLSQLFVFENRELPEPLSQIGQMLQHCSEEDLDFLIQHIEHLLKWRQK